MSQKKYIERVLERFNMKNGKPVFTPLTGHMKLSKNMCPTAREEKENMAKVPYSSVVRSLMYVMVYALDLILLMQLVLSTDFSTIEERSIGKL